jgi:hypothetical protein
MVDGSAHTRSRGRRPATKILQTPRLRTPRPAALPGAPRYGMTTTRSTVAQPRRSRPPCRGWKRLAVVPVAVHGEEHARFDLPNGRARPGRRNRASTTTNGALARSAEHRDDRLGHVREVRRDPTPARTPECLQRCGDPRYGRDELGVRHAAGELVLAAKDERIASRSSDARRASRFVGKVEPARRETTCAGASSSGFTSVRSPRSGRRSRCSPRPLARMPSPSSLDQRHSAS